jgi:hypothetical protein
MEFEKTPKKRFTENQNQTWFWEREGGGGQDKNLVTVIEVSE